MACCGVQGSEGVRWAPIISTGDCRGTPARSNLIEQSGSPDAPSAQEANLPFPDDAHDAFHVRIRERRAAGEAEPLVEYGRGDGPSDHRRIGEDRLEVERLPGGTGLDVPRLEGDANHLPVDPELVRVDQDA